MLLLLTVFFVFVACSSSSSSFSISGISKEFPSKSSSSSSEGEDLAECGDKPLVEGYVAGQLLDVNGGGGKLPRKPAFDKTSDTELWAGQFDFHEDGTIDADFMGPEEDNFWESPVSFKGFYKAMSGNTYQAFLTGFQHNEFPLVKKPFDEIDSIGLLCEFEVDCKHNKNVHAACIVREMSLKADEELWEVQKLDRLDVKGIGFDNADLMIGTLKHVTKQPELTELADKFFPQYDGFMLRSILHNERYNKQARRRGVLEI